jgi:hypothetical protein
VSVDWNPGTADTNTYGMDALIGNFAVQPAEAAAKDTYMDSFTPDTNYETSTALGVGLSLAGKDEHTFRSLLEFDISGLPEGATIRQAHLCLMAYTPDALTVEVTELVRADWSESESNWNRYKVGNTWTGPPFGASHDPDDIETDNEDSTAIDGTALKFDVLDAVNTAQHAWGTHSGIFRVRLASADGEAGDTVVYFGSSNIDSLGGNYDTRHRPILAIVYDGGAVATRRIFIT